MSVTNDPAVSEIPAGGRFRRGSRELLALCAVLGLMAGLAAGWLGYPRLASVVLTQPIRFSHSVHAKQDVACRTCHFTGPGGAFNGFPDIGVCASCHAEPTGGRSEDEKEADKLVVEYVRAKKAVPWLSLARQPDHVLFDHGPHLRFGCPACHPDMSRQDYPELRQDRISGYRNWTMSMERCQTCHRQQSASVDCVSCHR